MGRAVDVAKDYAAGMASGVAMVAAGHPFDTVKVRGLYRGATSSFVGVAIESSLLFGAYTQLKLALQGGERSTPTLPTIIGAAGLAGAGVSAVLCPTELVKIRGMYRGIQATALRESLGNIFYFLTYEAIKQTIRDLFTESGIRGLYAGLGPTLVRAFPANAVAIVTWELTARLLGVGHI